MFGEIFRYKGRIWHVFNNITDVLALSLLWALCSLPVVTLGAATTALYDSVVRCVRFGEEGPYRRFFRTFRSELLTGSLSTLLWGVVLFAGLYMLGALRVLSGENSALRYAAAAYAFILCIPLGAACWAFPILSRFSFSFSSLNLTAFRFVFAHLPSTVLVVAFTLGAMYLSAEYILALIVAPAMLMLLWSLPMEAVFKKRGGGLEASAEQEDQLTQD